MSKFTDSIYTLDKIQDTPLRVIKLDIATLKIYEQESYLYFDNLNYQSISMTDIDIISAISNEKDKVFIITANKLKNTYKVIIIKNNKEEEAQLFTLCLKPATGTFFQLYKSYLYYFSEKREIIGVRFLKDNLTEIANIIPLPNLNTSYIDKSFSYNGGFCLFAKGAEMFLKINIETNDVKVIRDSQEAVFNSINGIIKIRNENITDSLNGAFAFIVTENSVLAIDTIDDIICFCGISATNLDFTYNCIENKIYILSEGRIFNLDPYFLELYELPLHSTDIDLTLYNMYSIGSEEYVFKDNESYILSKDTDICRLAIYCINEAGDIIYEEEKILKRCDTPESISAPIIENHSADIDSDTIIPNVSDISITFSYNITKTPSVAIIKYTCENITLFEDVLYGYIGDTYNVQRHEINGFSYAYTSGNNGRFEKEVENITVFYLRDLNEEEAALKLKSFLDINVSCCGLYLKRVIPIENGKSVMIKSPSINFCKPVEESFLIEFAESSIVKVTKSYANYTEVAKVKLFYKNILILEDLAQVIRSDNEKPKLNCNLPNGMILTVDGSQDAIFESNNLHVDLLKKFHLYRVISQSTGEVILSYLSNGLVSNILNIDNYEYQKTVKSVVSNLDITDLHYSKISSIVKVIHKECESGEVVKEDVFQARIGSEVFVEYLDDNLYELNSEINSITHKNEDTVIELLYTKKKNSLTYTYIDVTSRNVLLEEVHFYKVEEETIKLPKINDRYISKLLFEFPVGEEVKNYSANYDIYVFEDSNTIKINSGFLSYQFDNILNYISDNFKNKKCINAVCVDGERNDNLMVLLKPANDSIKSLLNELQISFVEKNIEQLKELDEPFVLINSKEFPTTTHIINDNYLDSKCLYIPIDKYYKDLKQSILLAKEASIKTFSKKITTKDDIEANVNIIPKSYSINGKLTLDVDMQRTQKDITKVKIQVVNIQDLTILCEDNVVLKSNPDFKVFDYSINNCDYVLKKKFIEFNSNDDVVRVTIDVKGYDDLGNSTKTIKEYIEVFVKDVKSKQTIPGYKLPNIQRVNHRFKGPIESIKIIDSINAIDNFIEEIEVELKTISNFRSDVDEI